MNPDEAARDAARRKRNAERLDKLEVAVENLVRMLYERFTGYYASAS